MSTSRHAGEGQLDLFAATGPAVDPAPAAGLTAGARAVPAPSAGPGLEPMGTAAVEWIAQHVIADYYLANETTYGDPDQNWEPDCACQFPCTLCRGGNHRRCGELRRGQDPLKAARPETYLLAPVPFQMDRTTPRHTSVWLADRACRPLCDCTRCGPVPVPTTVVCLKGRQGDPLLTSTRFVYVGRPLFTGGWQLHGHPLANPFKVGKHGDPEAVVEQYRTWLDARPALLERALPSLRGKVLGCWCPAGQPCHARVLAEHANAYAEVTR